jgi:anaerobic magnesium-protoporphyrin IX monomethyl ester cyclase
LSGGNASIGDWSRLLQVSKGKKHDMDRLVARPKNDRVAMVQCPKWANLPPIALAYVKGAVRRPVQCFDLNHDLLKRSAPDYRERFDCQHYGRDIVPFMTSQPNFGTFEDVCRMLSEHYAPVFDEWVDRLKDYGVVGFSLYQENLAMSAILARRLRREHGVVCLAGGPSINMDGHVFARRLLGDGTLDLAVFGIAEDVIDELLERIIAGRDLADLAGLALPGSGGELFYTPAKRPDLSRFSPPNYDDFDLDDYYKDRSHWMYVYAVAGCVGNCEFCTIHEFYPGFRHKPVENIEQEMLQLHRRYGKNHFFFSDGMFLGKREDALRLFDFATSHGLKLGLQIRLLPYWDDEELVRKASQCVFFLQVGFESASPNVRKAMGKMVDQDRTERIYRLFYKYQIPLYSNVIIGYPNETDEDFQHTCRFLEEYLAADNHLVGSTVFFVPNAFPANKYDIRTDAAGHWVSNRVDVYDRLERVIRVHRLAERVGRPPRAVYAYSSVEGLPLDSLSPPPEDLRSIVVERYVEAPAASVGCFDRVAGAESYVQAWGWAKLPDCNQPGQEVLLLDPERQIVARAVVNHGRSDVAEHFRADSLERCGWVCIFRKSALRCPPESLQAYLYTAADRTAWRLASPGLLTRTLRSCVRDTPHAMRDRLKPVMLRGIRALPGGGRLIERLRTLSRRSTAPWRAMPERD